MPPRRSAIIVACLVCGCCPAPLTDPADPAASAPAQRAAAFLDAVADRRDAAAHAMLVPATAGTLESFSRRIDTLAPLRAPGDVQWTRVHYVQQGGAEPTQTFERCLGLSAPSVEVDGLLAAAGADGTTIQLVGSRDDAGWQWRQIRLGGIGVLPAPVRGPDAGTPAAGPAPAPSRSASTSRPPRSYPPPTESVQGRWAVGDFVVELATADGVWLQAYDAAFGLTLGLGDVGMFGQPKSKILLRTNCEGQCGALPMGDAIAGPGAKRTLDLAERDGSAAWVRSPAKVADATWMMHARATSAAGAPVLDIVRYAYGSPVSDGPWLECVLELRGAERDRLDELEPWCRTLSWSFDATAKAGRPPIEARFEGRYAIGGVEIEVPTPQGFAFASYSPAQSSLVFHGQRSVLDTVSMQTGCDGSCGAALLRDNVRQAAADKLAAALAEGGTTVQPTPGNGTAPGRVYSRVAGTAFDKPKLDITVTAFPEGADRFVRCEVHLYDESVARGDELQAVCTDALSSY